MGKEAAERKEKEINKQIGNFKFCNCVVNDIKNSYYGLTLMPHFRASFELFRLFDKLN